MMKKCGRCFTEKDIGCYSVRNLKTGLLNSWCKVCVKTYDKDRYKTLPLEIREKRLIDINLRRIDKRNWYIELKKDKKCTDCKRLYPYYVLQFDHLRDKKFNISSEIFNLSKEEILIEIEKCDIVCANCHCARTFKRREVD